MFIGVTIEILEFEIGKISINNILINKNVVIDKILLVV